MSECQAVSGVELEHVPQEITQAWATSQSQQKQHRPHPAGLSCSPVKETKREERRLTDTIRSRKDPWRATLVHLHLLIALIIVENGVSCLYICTQTQMPVTYAYS